jgi:DmsE family decaheme c-type cytochrome
MLQQRVCRAAICLLSATLAVRTVSTAAPVAPAAAATPAVAAAPDAQTPAGIQATAGAANGYVGSDTCTVCHTEGESLKATQHGQAKNARSPEATLGCESCHGPGQAHVDDDAKGHIRKFDKIAPAEINQTCLTCHNRGENAGWEASAHEQRNLACTTCHSVHSPKSTERQLVKANEDQLCATCHRLQVTKTERSVAHMPVRENKMSCSSCHNPHGSLTNVKALRVGNSVSEACQSCHAEKRAPVLWEHAPVKEDCATCHDPHGSSNDRMLIVRMPMLCQRCHIATSHPSTLYDNNAITVNKSNRMFGRSCVNCHQAIHGSNQPSGQYFLR